MMNTDTLNQIAEKLHLPSSWAVDYYEDCGAGEMFVIRPSGLFSSLGITHKGSGTSDAIADALIRKVHDQKYRLYDMMRDIERYSREHHDSEQVTREFYECAGVIESIAKLKK